MCSTRVEERGDLFAPVLELKQKLPGLEQLAEELSRAAQVIGIASRGRAEPRTARIATARRRMPSRSSSGAR